jgi:hypothetical protein
LCGFDLNVAPGPLAPQVFAVEFGFDFVAAAFKAGRIGICEL